MKSCWCVVSALRAAAKPKRFTPALPLRNRSLARFSIHRVTSRSAGPPCVGLYLNPPSSGGLCEGVMTMPSARRSLRPRLCTRIAREITGVGVTPSFCWMTVCTWLPARTSSAVRWADPESACVSRPMNSGPSVPRMRRKSQMAWVMARIWASVNEPRSDEPRCPLVPKLTRCSGSPRSGWRSKYSRSRRAGSTSISLRAGLPARGEMVMHRSFSWHRTRLRSPDFSGVLGDRVVAGELPAAGHVQDGLARPGVAVAVQRGQPLVRLEIGPEVGQMQVVVSLRQQRVPQRSEDARLVAAEMIGEDHVQRGAGLRLVVVMPVRVVPIAAGGHLFGGQAKQEEVLFTGFLGHFDRCAVARADRQRTIHHELHVARAARLVAGRRDLVGDVGAGDQPLGDSIAAAPCSTSGPPP